MHSLTTPADPVLQFGPYTFHLRQRQVMRGDQALRLGGKALDILQVLVERAGCVVSKQALIARVWPRSFVEDINLRVHIAALRRALGEGRYIVTVPQQGYCFVAEIRPAVVEATPGPAFDDVRHNLPACLSQVIGRDGWVWRLVRQLSGQRFITLVGPGGLGKSTIACRAAEALAPRYRDGVWRIDVSMLDTSGQLDEQLAMTLSPGARQPARGLPAELAGRHLLLVLDNCERLAEPCRRWAERLLAGCPGISILVTSRVALGLASEHVLPVPPLAVPPCGQLDVESALSWSALELFVRRAQARQPGFQLQAQNMQIVSEICRRLDGMPLAIEMAATQIDAFGLVGLRAQMDRCLEVLTLGRRTAATRHLSLRASLDWSHDLLGESERAVFRRLGVFDSPFTAQAAIEVVGSAGLGAQCVQQTLARLVEQSLLSSTGHAGRRYALLNTSRLYALEKLEHSGELATYAPRHARLLSLQRLAVTRQHSMHRVE